MKDSWKTSKDIWKYFFKSTSFFPDIIITQFLFEGVITLGSRRSESERRKSHQCAATRALMATFWPLSGHLAIRTNRVMQIIKDELIIFSDERKFYCGIFKLDTISHWILGVRFNNFDEIVTNSFKLFWLGLFMLRLTWKFIKYKIRTLLVIAIFSMYYKS